MRALDFFKKLKIWIFVRSILGLGEEEDIAFLEWEYEIILMLRGDCILDEERVPIFFPYQEIGEVTENPFLVFYRERINSADSWEWELGLGHF